MSLAKLSRKSGHVKKDAGLEGASRHFEAVAARFDSLHELYCDFRLQLSIAKSLKV